MKRVAFGILAFIFIISIVGFASAESDSNEGGLWNWFKGLFTGKVTKLGPKKGVDRPAPLNNTNITCYNNAGCPPPVNNYFCSGSNACFNTTSYSCINPGTPQSSCIQGGGGSCAPCSFGCSNGQCNQNSTNQTHLACVGNTCSVVNGGGANQCSPVGSACGNQTNSTLPTKRVFVTSFNVPSPNFVNISVVDGYCSQAKNQAGLGGAWRAWISFNNLSAGTRVIDAKYIRVGDSVKVADNKADLLDGTLDNPINRNQFGNVNNSIVMTGTNKNGNVLSGKNCNNWQSSSANYTGAIGSSSLSNGNWTNSGTYNCNNLVNSARIYCFEI